MATERLRPWQQLLTDTAPTDPKVSSRYVVYTGSTFTEIITDAAGNEYTPAAGGGSVAWGSITGTLTDQTDLVTALGLKADKATTVSAGTGLTGGGDLSANRTLAADFGSTAGKVCEGNDSRLNAQTITLTGDVTGSGTGSFAATIAAKKAWRDTPPTLSNNVTDATNDVDISAGLVWDNANDVLLELASALTKRLDASWAVGTNQGGLDTGSKANSTWYHTWLIRRSDTGVVDVLFSTSATSPTMPTNYDHKRHIGWVLTDGSGVIRPFLHKGQHWYWKTAVLDLSTTSPTNTTLVTMTVPPGEAVEWVGTIFVNNTTVGIRGSVGPADGTNGNTIAIYSQVANTNHTSHAQTITNASSQIRYDVGSTSGWNGGGFNGLYLTTAGWVRLAG